MERQVGLRLIGEVDHALFGLWRAGDTNPHIVQPEDTTAFAMLKDDFKTG